MTLTSDGNITVARDVSGTKIMCIVSLGQAEQQAAIYEHQWNCDFLQSRRARPQNLYSPAMLRAAKVRKGFDGFASKILGNSGNISGRFNSNSSADKCLPCA